jgi:hypothetical protein
MEKQVEQEGKAMTVPLLVRQGIEVRTRRKGTTKNL